MAHVVSLKLLEKVFTSPHALSLTEGSPAHEAGLMFVAEVLPFTQDVDQIRDLTKSTLPKDYPGNLLKEVPEMVRSGIRKGLHQRKGVDGNDDRKQSEVILEAVAECGGEFFNSPQFIPHIRIPGKHGGKEVHPVRSTFMKELMRRLYYEKTGKPPGNMAVREAQDQLEANARYNAPVEEVHIRIANYQGGVIIDLGDETNRAIKITRDGWEVIDESPVNFVRPHGAVKPLPFPESGFDPEELRKLLGMSMPNFILMIAFCINALNPHGPFFVLQIHGEQGAGKTIIAKIIKDLIDCNVADKLRMPKSEQDLVLQAQGQWLLNFENASYVSNDLSDLLCTMATGGAFATRKLYTDNEMIIMAYKRPVMMNGIGNFATRPDLLERSIFLNLTAIQKGKRKTERELHAELDKLMPKFLGYLLDCASCALANLDEVDPPRSIRMADAAHWLVAAEPATGFPEGSILDALEMIQREILAQSAMDDTLTVALMELLLNEAGHVYEGRYGQLHEEIIANSRRFGKGLPASPSALSSKLKRMQPGYRQIGLEIEEGMRSSSGQTVILRLTNEGVALAKEITSQDNGDGNDHGQF